MIFISTHNQTSLVRTFISVAFFTVSLLCFRIGTQEKTIVRFVSGLRHCLQKLLSLKTLSHFPLKVGFLSFLILGD